MRLSHLLSVLVFSFAVWFTMAHIFVQGEFLTGRSLQAAAAGTVADTVIDFDDLPLNTVVSTQYHNEGGTDAGVDFVQGFQAGTLPVIAQVAAGEAPSGTQIGKITFICPRPECPTAPPIPPVDSNLPNNRSRSR